MESIKKKETDMVVESTIDDKTGGERLTVIIKSNKIY